VYDVVRERLFSLGGQRLVVHEPQNQLENGDGIHVIGVLALVQERRFDRFSFHSPDVRLKITNIFRTIAADNADIDMRTVRRCIYFEINVGEL